MGTISEKLTYLNGTKQLLKDKINNLGGDITSQTTFRNYANQLQNVYDNLPKTDYEEGSNITLSNTLKGKLDYENGVVGIGQSEQDGTPTPDNEVSIQCVTGNQDVVVSGKNKLNFSDVTLESHGVTLQIKDNYFILNGTNDGTESAFIISNYMTPFQTNANTKLKAFQISGTATGSIANPLFRTYTNWQNQVNVNFTSSTISDYSEEATYNTSIIAVHGGTFNNYKIGFMVADNLTSGDTYEPYITPTSYQLSLGDIELNAIGNYKDELIYDVDEDKVYKNENVNEHIFTENENISLQSINSYGIANFFISHSLGSVSNLALCNYFTLQTSGISVTQEEGFLWQHNGVYFRIKSSTASDVSSFKTWLNSHSVKVEYALAETSREEITDTNLHNQVKALYNAQSINGTTIITSNGDLPMIIKVRGLKGE